MNITPSTLFSKLTYTLDYMEQNIHSDINLDHLSRNVFISKFYLHRIFKALTGENIMTYFRKRKLSVSAEYLLHTNLRISDIACEFDFDHYQSYLRSFRNTFNITPQQFRNGKAPIVFFEKLSADQLIPVEGGMLKKPEIKLMSAISLVGKRHKISLRENYANQTANQAGIHFFYSLKRKIMNTINPKIYYGLTYFSGDYPEYTDYLPSTQVVSAGSIPEGMEFVTLPSKKYYCFRYVGMHHPSEISSLTLASLWRSIFAEWMPSIGYTPTLQIEIINYGISSKNYCEMDLLYPKEE